MSNISKVLGLLGLSGVLMGLSAGDPAPDFSATNQVGQTVQLSDFKGKPVLIYFYPKDDTPGCRREACEFRDRYSEIKKLGAVILGVSSQDGKSHLEFQKKHQLPFDLLVDSDGEIAKKLGVGRIFGFHKRQSVLIGSDGRVLKVYLDVDPARHADQVIQDLKALDVPNAPKASSSTGR